MPILDNTYQENVFIETEATLNYDNGEWVNTTDKIKQAERYKSGENVNEEAIKYESDIKPAENVNQDARLESAAKLDSRPEGSFGV